MNKKILAGLGTLLAAACTACSTADEGGGDAPGVTRIAFSESATFSATGLSEEDPAPRDIVVFAAHKGDKVSRLRFLTSSADQPLEERYWTADSPESVKIRDWTSCKEISDAMPPPTPSTPESVTEQFFGPSRIPGDARRNGDGEYTWSTTESLVTTEYTDHGGDFPDRTVKIIGPTGELAGTIQNGKVGDVREFPGWRDDWKTCAPHG
ncbi:hypothetical protein [Streptomyces sp. NPDC052042]|uniref:hypothetical protein n=1 Tax=Streptomyces sp. NPDC052042 TaxID=3365683 RepID=UPI0037D209F2